VSTNTSESYGVTDVLKHVNREIRQASGLSNLVPPMPNREVAFRAGYSLIPMG
jgi:hypothetical protein